MLRSGVIAKKLGMTRLFMETDADAGDRSSTRQSCRSWPSGPPEGGLFRRPARRRHGQGQAGLRADARPLRQGLRRTEAGSSWNSASTPRTC